MIKVPYILVQLVYRHHKPEWFHAMIDTGSDVTMISANAFPARYWRDLRKPLQVVVASGQITKLTKAVFGQFLSIYDLTTHTDKVIPLPTVVIQAPPNATYNFLLGVDFLTRFTEFASDHTTIRLLTPCGHWLQVPVVSHPATRSRITFHPRSNRGEIPLATPREKRQKRPSSLLLAFSTTQKAFEFRLEAEVKTLLQANFDDNPLKYWDKDKSYADIQLKDSSSIVRVKPMRYNQTDEHEFKIQLRELEDKQLAFRTMEENKSPHSSPAFMVNNHSEQKRGKPRMVINYKRLNDLTIFDGYFLPNKELLINKTLNKKWFSKFDCKSGFYQIKLTDAAKPLTAFSTPQGQYIWNVMPMGLKNAPQIFQRRMDNIFTEYSDFCLVYVDDILIFSDNIAEHAEHLMKFIQKSRNHGLILSDKKAKIAKKQIEFLGLKIDHTGIEMQPHICEKIANFPDKLTDRKQVERFLGCINYINDFLPNLAWLRGPLQDLLKKRMNQQWQDYHTSIVEQLKRLCTKLPRLAIPETGDQLIVETDASERYWGGVLKAKKGDTEHICRYANGSFKPAEINYHSNEKELLALKRSFAKFHFFILPVRFLVRTDNTNVKAYIFNKLPCTPEYKRRHRWQQYFQEYQFDIEHIKGKHNYLADFLSREANDGDGREHLHQLKREDIARNGDTGIGSSTEPSV